MRHGREVPVAIWVGLRPEAKIISSGGKIVSDSVQKYPKLDAKISWAEGLNVLPNGQKFPGQGA